MKIYDRFDAWMSIGSPAGILGDETEYPIAGCREVISRVLAEARGLEPECVLCVGAGSSIIASELYNDGCDVWIADMNLDKLKRLAAKLPKAHFLHCDIFDVLPEAAYEQQFDAIICTYNMHTAGDDERFFCIEDFDSMVSDGGRVIIGDVCFWTSAEREICRRRCNSYWDGEASYIVYDDFRRLFQEDCIRFTRISHCAGVIVLGDFSCDDNCCDDT